MLTNNQREHRHLRSAQLGGAAKQHLSQLNVILVSCLELLGEGLKCSTSDHYLNLLKTRSERKWRMASFETAGLLDARCCT